eukprot:13350872-Alexandrium_andersonii.AAC.1
MGYHFISLTLQGMRAQALLICSCVAPQVTTPVSLCAFVRPMRGAVPSVADATAPNHARAI